MVRNAVAPDRGSIVAARLLALVALTTTRVYAQAEVAPGHANVTRPSSTLAAAQVTPDSSTADKLPDATQGQPPSAAGDARANEPQSAAPASAAPVPPAHSPGTSDASVDARRPDDQIAPQASAAPATSEAQPASPSHQHSLPTPIAADFAEPEDSRPLKQPFNIAFNSDSRWNRDSSLDLFSANDLTTFVGLSVGYAFWFTDQVSLVPEAGYGFDSQSSKGLFGGAIAEADVDVHDVYLSVSARYELAEILEPHVRLGGGLSIVNLALRTPTESGEFETSAVSPFGSLGAGFSLKTPDRALSTSKRHLTRLELALLVEAGYVLAAPVDVDLDSPQGSRIATAEPNLGALERSAPYLRLSLGTRF